VSGETFLRKLLAMPVEAAKLELVSSGLQFRQAAGRE
jgi:hypothetical protein